MALDQEEPDAPGGVVDRCPDAAGVAPVAQGGQVDDRQLVHRASVAGRRCRLVTGRGVGKCGQP